MLQNTSAGLSEAEAKSPPCESGRNRLRGKKGASVAAMFFSQFKDLMILILAAATPHLCADGRGARKPLPL